jgi:hypothetical protein
MKDAGLSIANHAVAMISHYNARLTMNTITFSISPYCLYQPFEQMGYQSWRFLHFVN